MNKVNNADIKTPKIYFIDIDGTLVNGHKNLNLHVDDLHSIKRAARNGTYIVLSTGRSYDDMKKIWDLISDGSDQFRYAIVNNGSGIWDVKANKLLSEDYLDEVSFRELHDYAKKHDYAIKNSLEKVFYVKKGILSFLLGSFSKTNAISHEFEEAIYNKKSAKKLGMITRARKSKVAKIAKDIDGKFPHVDVAISGPGLYIELNKTGVSKGTGLKFVCDLLEIDVKESVHIGDSMNDAPGFAAAGYGVAMGNSMKELKKRSDFITTPLKKGGVSNVLKSFGNI